MQHVENPRRFAGRANLPKGHRNYRHHRLYRCSSTEMSQSCEVGKGPRLSLRGSKMLPVLWILHHPRLDLAIVIILLGLHLISDLD
jgi:hypothetical protein